MASIATLAVKRYSIPRKGKEYTVLIYDVDQASVYWQAITPATGTPSGPAQDVQHFTGVGAEGQALGAWMQAAGLIGGAG